MLPLRDGQGVVDVALGECQQFSLGSLGDVPFSFDHWSRKHCAQLLHE